MAGSQFRLARAGRQGVGRTAAQKGGGARVYLLLALLLPAAVVLLPSAMLLSAAMLPTLVAWIVDGNPRKQLAATVGGLNFAGALYFLARLWTWQHDVATALELLGDVYGWLIAYGAAAAGYGVYYATPSLTARVAELRAQRRLSRVERAMQDLVEEWGEPVSRPSAD